MSESEKSASNEGPRLDIGTKRIMITCAMGMAVGVSAGILFMEKGVENIMEEKRALAQHTLDQGIHMYNFGVAHGGINAVRDGKTDTREATSTQNTTNSQDFIGNMVTLYNQGVTQGRINGVQDLQHCMEQGGPRTNARIFDTFDVNIYTAAQNPEKIAAACRKHLLEIYEARAVQNMPK